MQYRFLTGSYAKKGDPGVCRFAFDGEGGFRLEKAWNGFINPSFVLVHPDKPMFYTVEETSPVGKVHAWQYAENAPVLTGSFPSGGDSPCHLSLSQDKRYLYVSNYMSGALAVFALDQEGRILKMTDLVQLTGHGPNPDRQEGPHAHCELETDGVLYLCDLGTDTILAYLNNNGKLEKRGEIKLPGGSGPRHLAVCPAHPGFLYCDAEMGNEVYVIMKTETDYKIVQHMPTLPECFVGSNTTAAIHFTADGKFLMVSNRGHDSIAAYGVKADGTLSRPVISSCAAEPRDFILLDDYAVVGSQRKDLIRAYRLNRETGKLAENGWTEKAGCPVCFAAL